MNRGNFLWGVVIRSAVVSLVFSDGLKTGGCAVRSLHDDPHGVDGIARAIERLTAAIGLERAIAEEHLSAAGRPPR
jgi:hypothetical protein